MCFITILLRKCEEVRRPQGRREGQPARWGEQPQIWLRLGSALLFIFQLKSAQKPNRNQSSSAAAHNCGLGRGSWRRRRSSCCLVWHVSVSNARVATGVAAVFINALDFSRVRLMRNLCAVTQQKSQLVSRVAAAPSTPSGQVHHYVSHFLLKNCVTQVI